MGRGGEHSYARGYIDAVGSRRRGGKHLLFRRRGALSVSANDEMKSPSAAHVDIYRDGYKSVDNAAARAGSRVNLEKKVFRSWRCMIYSRVPTRLVGYTMFLTALS